MSWRAKRMEQRRLEKLYEETGRRWYGPGAYRSDKKGGRLCRSYSCTHSHPNIKKWFRRYSNRRFRRNKNEYWREDILQRGQHKKSFDLWWTMW